MKRSFLLFVTLLAACAKPTPTATAPVFLEADGKQYRITGPYAHENLAVYLLHSDARDDRDFITLDEGLKSGKVTVTEKSAEGQVSELLLENAGDLSLFIQEGDRVKGGKQDRIVGLSFVVPAKSGKHPIPSFCIERGRWAGKSGAFEDCTNRAIASKEIRQAAKVSKSQQEVWKEVDNINRAAPERIGNGVRSTSLNETADSPEAKKAVHPYEKSLASILEGKADAVGVAFALNGVIEEINVYPGARLLAKLYPRLLESYALSAVLTRKDSTAPVPAVADVSAFMKEGKEKSRRSEEAVGNGITLFDYEKQVRCQTVYGGQVVHAQWMRSEPRVFTDIDGRPQQRQQVEEQNQAPRR
jgi:hypothetical protein